MGNQQERPNVGLAWAAGLAVGEGCFTIQVMQHRHNRLSFRPMFVLSMNDKTAVEHLAQIFKDNDLPCYLNERSNRKTVEFRVIGYKRTARVIAALLPYLTGDKRRAAEIVGRFCESRLAKAPKSPPTMHEIDLIRQIREHNGFRNHKITLGILRDYTPNFGKHVREDELEVAPKMI